MQRRIADTEYAYLFLAAIEALVIITAIALLVTACSRPPTGAVRQPVDLTTVWDWVPTIPYSAARNGADGHDFLFDSSGKPIKELVAEEQGNRLSEVDLTTGVITDFAMSQSGPEDAHYCDLDKDGVPDRVAASAGNSRIWVVFGGTTTAVTIAASQGHGRYLKVTCGDFDGDGNMDLAGGSYAGSATAPAVIDILYGSSSRSGTSFTYQLATYAGQAMTLDAVDLDGDGDLDLLVTDQQGYKLPGDTAPRSDLQGVREVENVGGKVWANHTLLGAPYAGDQRFGVATDWDGDGHVDIISTRSHAGQPNYTDILLGPSFTSHTVITDTHAAGHTQGVAKGDLDGDGCPDLVYTSTKTDTCCDTTVSGVWQLHSNCDGTFTWGEISGHDGSKYDGVTLIVNPLTGALDVWVDEQLGVTMTGNQLGAGRYENRLLSASPDGPPDAAVDAPHECGAP